MGTHASIRIAKWDGTSGSYVASAGSGTRRRDALPRPSGSGKAAASRAVTTADTYRQLLRAVILPVLSEDRHRARGYESLRGGGLVTEILYRHVKMSGVTEYYAVPTE